MYSSPKFEGKTKLEIHKEKQIHREMKIVKKHMDKLEIRVNVAEKQFSITCHEYDLLDDKLRTLRSRWVNRCKHNYPRMYWANNRSDASFNRYCGCTNCGELIWDECK